MEHQKRKIGGRLESLSNNLKEKTEHLRKSIQNGSLKETIIETVTPVVSSIIDTAHSALDKIESKTIGKQEKADALPKPYDLATEPHTDDSSDIDAWTLDIKKPDQES